MSTYNVDKMPIQSFVDKLAKNHAFSIMSAQFDPTTEMVHYEVAVNDTKRENRDLTFAEACKSFGWNSFTFDDLYIYPVCDEPFVKPEVTNTLDKENPDHIVHNDENWLKGNGYNWMSNLRITNPMNISDPATSSINESMRKGIYYSINSINEERFWNDVKIADSMAKDEDVDSIDVFAEAE